MDGIFSWQPTGGRRLDLSASEINSGCDVIFYGKKGDMKIGGGQRCGHDVHFDFRLWNRKTQSFDGRVFTPGNRRERIVQCA